MILAVILGPPAVALFLVVEAVSVWVGVAMFAAAFVALFVVLVIQVFGAESALRPLMREVTAALPPEFEPSAPAPRLALKALAPLPPVALFAALMVGAFIDVAKPGPGRLGVALGIALASVAVAGVLFWIVTRTVLEPVDELLAATSRVSAGDISTPVPVITADEFGTLAIRFNEMLASLRSHERELRASRARIVSAADDARRRVERDLHDGAQQQLVLLGLKLGLAERQGQTDPSAAMATIRELRTDHARALSELRDLAHGIYPAVLENEGVPAALREAARFAAVPTELECDGMARYDPEIEAAVYFCCLEALQNTAKHAGDQVAARVRLAERDGVVEFEVSDDGPGFDPAEQHASSGLQNMADRVGALGGTLNVDAAPARGVKVSGRLPIEA
jgi:signal transduction histidine kinase